jgi:hypothetical protein
VPADVPSARLAPLPTAAVLVVRGDVLDPEVLKADVPRFVKRYPDWGRCGFFGFLANNDIDGTSCARRGWSALPPSWCSVSQTLWWWV